MCAVSVIATPKETGPLAAVVSVGLDLKVTFSQEEPRLG